MVFAASPSHQAPIAASVKAVRFSTPPWQQWQYAPFVTEAKQLSLPGYGKTEDTHKTYLSDTGELEMNFVQGLFTIDTPRTQAAIGRLKTAKSVRLGSVTIEACQTDFAAITVTAMDDRPMEESRRLFVTTVARAENTAQGFWPQPGKPDSWSPSVTWMLPGQRRQPVIAEPVDASITVPVSGNNARVYALDSTGRRKQEMATTMDSSGPNASSISFNPKQGRTIWFEVVSKDTP